MIAVSTLSCPACGHVEAETMATDACRYVYDGKACAAVLRPRPGDCCVFWSHGDVMRPPIQEGSRCAG